MQTQKVEPMCVTGEVNVLTILPFARMTLSCLSLSSNGESLLSGGPRKSIIGRLSQINVSCKDICVHPYDTDVLYSSLHVLLQKLS